MASAPKPARTATPPTIETACRSLGDAVAVFGGAATFGAGRFAASAFGAGSSRETVSDGNASNAFELVLVLASAAFCGAAFAPKRLTRPLYQRRSGSGLA